MSFVKEKDLKHMLDGIDSRIIEMFGVYEYKPTPRATKSFLGVYDIDLIKKLEKLGYRTRVQGYDRVNDVSFVEFEVFQHDYWKIRKIIFNLLRVEKLDYFYKETLGEDYKDWCFKVEVPKYYKDRIRV